MSCVDHYVKVGGWGHSDYTLSYQYQFCESQHILAGDEYKSSILENPGKHGEIYHTVEHTPNCIPIYNTYVHIHLYLYLYLYGERER